MVQRFEQMIGDRLLSIETGRLAGQANGSVMVRYGDTVVLATATATKEPRPDIDFFPLTVDYEERMYAAGKIPGGFFKREGRPSEQAILTMRLTDRPMRPLFPKGFRNDVQIILTVLSADQENTPDILCIIGASAALTISDIPFEGPVGAARVGYIDGQFVLNPPVSQYPQSTLDLAVAGTRNAIVMVEGGSKEVDESIIVEGLRFAHNAVQPIIDLQQRMRDAIGKEKFAFPVAELPAEVYDAVKDFVGDRMDDVIYQPDKQTREELRDELVAEALAQLGERFPDKQILNAIEELCNRCILLDGGRMIEDSRDVRAVIRRYLAGIQDEVRMNEWRSDGTRYLNPYFKPLRLALTGADGRPLDLPAHNDAEMWVEIEGEIEQLDPALNVGYAIYDEENRLLYWSYHTDRAEADWPRLEAGRVRLRGELPRRLLNEGAYRLELIAGLHFRQWLLAPGENAPSINLEIQGGLSDSPFWIAKRPGILAPALRWERL